MGINGRNTRRGLFNFDTPDGEFELLETERGEPGFWGGWRERPRERKPDDASDKIGDTCKANRARLTKELRGEINTDLILRTFRIGGRVMAFAAFLNGMADEDQINDFILKPSMRRGCLELADGEQNLSKFVVENVFAMQEATLSSSWQQSKTAIEDGLTVVFLEGETQTVIMDTRGYASRSVGQPASENVILGPHEGFTENIRTNVTLLRRIVRTDDFVVEFRKSGGKNNNRIAIAYREGVANRTLVNEVKRRFARIDTLMVLSIGTLEQLTEAHPYSPLPQSLSTERPDRVAAHIMQGHVAVLCEGSPLANVMPATLFAIMSSGEDAYLRQPVGSIVRLIRYLGAFLSIIMPAYFLALSLHHQGMLSSEVLSTVIASRNMVFLPLAVEMLFLLFLFQLLREATVSAPGAMGQSVGIIGGVLLGQAAVSANIVSKVVLIVVALAGLGNFTIPDYTTQIAASYYRIALVVAAWLGGLLGVFSVILLTVATLSGLKSYGVPFLSPISPKTYAKGHVFVRGRVTMHERPDDTMNTGGQQA